MNVYSNVTEQDFINLGKFAEQQENEGALKIKNRILKQLHGINLAESSSHKIKKLEEVKKSTRKLGDVLKKLNSENGNN